MHNVFIKGLVFFPQKNLYVILLFKIFEKKDTVLYDLHIGLSKFISDFKKFSTSAPVKEIYNTIYDIRKKNFEDSLPNYQKIYNSIRKDVKIHSLHIKDWENAISEEKKKFEEELNNCLPQIFLDRSYQISLNYEISLENISLENLLLNNDDDIPNYNLYHDNDDNDNDNDDDDSHNNNDNNLPHNPQKDNVPCNVVLDPVHGIPLRELKKGDSLQVKIDNIPANKSPHDTQPHSPNPLNKNLLKKAKIKKITQEKNGEISLVVELDNDILGYIAESENIKVLSKNPNPPPTPHIKKHSINTPHSRFNSKKWTFFTIEFLIILALLIWLIIYQY